MGRCSLSEGADRNRVRHTRLSYERARRTPAVAARDGRAAAPDGGDAQQRTVQSRPPDLCRLRPHRYRTALRPAITYRLVRLTKTVRAATTGGQADARKLIDGYARGTGRTLRGIGSWGRRRGGQADGRPWRQNRRQ